jgi:hypothetical protein
MFCCVPNSVASFRASLTALGRWSDRKDAKFLQLNLFEDLLDNKLGGALKRLNGGIAAVIEGGSLPSKFVHSACRVI